MNIDPIRDGIVIDHITAGRSMRLYELLGLDHADCSVALIKNVPSAKMGRKDIIKIDGNIPVDLDLIAYVDPKATIDLIRDGAVAEKKVLRLPHKLTNVVRCTNPRCITSTEQGLDQVFLLTDEEKGVYRCMYCEAKAK